MPLVLAGPSVLFPRLRYPWVDAGYSGKGADWGRAVLDRTVEVVKRPQRWVWLPEGAEPPPMPTGFRVLKRRWVAERTFAWLGRYRRPSKDYEVLPASEEARIDQATATRLLRRLARCPSSQTPSYGSLRDRASSGNLAIRRTFARCGGRPPRRIDGDFQSWALTSPAVP